MYHPSTRLLAVLELLQNHHTLSGEEIARRLEVEPRTVRRYIVMLQDMGMPVETTRGPGGGYRLLPNFKLPPLLFTEDEATAVVLGLLGTVWLELGLSSMAVESALAKVSRILPQRARARLNAVSTHLTLGASGQVARPDAVLLLNLSEAIHQHQRITIDYHSPYNQVTQRTVEPYGITGWRGHWYLVGYCCLREGYRTFRLDRMQNVQTLDATFEVDQDFDYRTYMHDQYDSSTPRWHINIEFQVPLAVVQDKIPTSYGTLTATPTGTAFETDYEDLTDLARYIVAMGLPFVIHEPQELRDALLTLADQMRQIATMPHLPKATL